MIKCFFHRAFLHFHGLSLMWSWMVDLAGATQLKVEILSTLSILPIANKNVLEDSKVLPMVVRWSEGGENDIVMNLCFFKLNWTPSLQN